MNLSSEDVERLRKPTLHIFLEISSCGMDKTTLPQEIETALKDKISFLRYQNSIELKIAVQWNFQSLSNLLYHVPTVSLLLF